MCDNNYNSCHGNYEKIGYHTFISEEDLPEVDTLQTFLIPPQEFFNKNINISIYRETIKRWKNSKENIKKDRKIFVHGSYCINLSNPAIVSVNALRNQLRLANEIDADGVVIHCGKYLKLQPEEGKKLFMDSIGRAIDRATEKCPIIIETCVGAGTELFWQLEEFQDMVLSLVKIHGRKIGCCIDTAHCWGSGVSPRDFLNGLTGEMRGTIRLIHWNNSSVKRGSHTDRHASINEGNIDPNELWTIAHWAIQHKIPLVIE